MFSSVDFASVNILNLCAALFGVVSSVTYIDLSNSIDPIISFLSFYSLFVLGDDVAIAYTAGLSSCCSSIHSLYVLGDGVVIVDTVGLSRRRCRSPNHSLFATANTIG